MSGIWKHVNLTTLAQSGFGGRSKGLGGVIMRYGLGTGIWALCPKVGAALVWGHGLLWTRSRLEWAYKIGGDETSGAVVRWQCCQLLSAGSSSSSTLPWQCQYEVVARIAVAEEE